MKLLSPLPLRIWQYSQQRGGWNHSPYAAYATRTHYLVLPRPSRPSLATSRLCWPEQTRLSPVTLVHGFHTRSGPWYKDPGEASKVEQTVQVLKEKLKDESVSAEKAAASSATQGQAVHPSAPSSANPQTTVQPAAVEKKTIGQRIMAELRHYWNGSKLLVIQTRIAFRLLRKVLNGDSLTRRERRQFTRTVADLFRLLPFLVFVIVPFMEFLLPVALKLFPNMLPSTFQEESKEQEKLKKTFKMKLEMAKFLQDTIEETAVLVKTKGEHVSTAKQFAEFIQSIRQEGRQPDNKEIIKFSKLFEDELTLDNLPTQQLRALCRLVEVQSVGPSNLLRFLLRMKLRNLEADDKMIASEGIDSLNIWELQAAGRARGMRSLGISEERLKSQLQQWIDLHLNQKIPTSLLLLSRALYLPEHLPAEQTLKEAISALPEAAREAVKMKAAEVEGEKVDNTARLELVKKEEEAIKKEALEAALKKKQEAAVEPAAETVITTPPHAEMLVDKATVIADKPVKEDKEAKLLSSQEFVQLEEALEKITKKGESELDELKEDISEYKEDVRGLREIVVASRGGIKLKESKSAQRVAKKVEHMVKDMDSIVKNLQKEKNQIIEHIELKEVRIRRSDELQQDETKRKAVLSEIDAERRQLISINELLLAVKRIQRVPNETREQRVLELVQALDEDEDGKVDVEHALKVIELIGQENVKLSKEQIREIINVVKLENVVQEDENKKKQ